jgi:sec-independent protein translocase protein TatA
MRIFKSEIKEMQADSQSAKPDQPAAPTQIASERVPEAEPSSPDKRPA